MIEVRETDIFTEWLARLKDEVAKAEIAARIRRLVERI
jgi:putative component of toxin-antitoxin plasmid stabilization module